uniref:Uncharacterized protein n=1 Tax=Arundo donax TaxID=35708 RepID=A0A0A9EV81_ARUDO
MPARGSSSTGGPGARRRPPPRRPCPRPTRRRGRCPSALRRRLVFWVGFFASA